MSHRLKGYDVPALQGVVCHIRNCCLDARAAPAAQACRSNGQMMWPNAQAAEPLLEALDALLAASPQRSSRCIFWLFCRSGRRA